LLPKNQQKLTKILDLVKGGLSYLWLFLEFPETIWSLQNRSYIKNTHILVPPFRFHITLGQKMGHYTKNSKKSGISLVYSMTSLTRLLVFSLYFVGQICFKGEKTPTFLGDKK